MLRSTVAMAKHLSINSQPSLTARLRQLADSAGWPKEIITALSVVEKEGDLEVQVAEDYKEIVNKLEYGTESTPPVSVIRKFNFLIEEIVQEKMNDSFKVHAKGILEEL